MNNLNKLQSRVRAIYNETFPWQINSKEQNVSKAVIAGIGRLYSETNELVTPDICLCLHRIKNIKPERKKLRMCKQLLLGKGICLPKLKSDFRIKDIYSDFIPGKKIRLDINDEQFN